MIFYLILGYFLFVLFRLVSGVFRIANAQKEQQEQRKTNWQTQDSSVGNHREKDISGKGKILEEKWLDGEERKNKKKR